MNRPDPPHLTINSCFSASRSVWVHLAMFHYYTKLNAKRVEQVQLMHKFGPWSCFGIFLNEFTRPTPLDLNSCNATFRSVREHFAMFHYKTKVGAKRVAQVQLMHKFVPWSCFGIFHKNAPDPLHWTLNSCFGEFRSVGCIWQCFITTWNSVQNRLNWCN